MLNELLAGEGKVSNQRGGAVRGTGLLQALVAPRGAPGFPMGQHSASWGPPGTPIVTRQKADAFPSGPRLPAPC